MARPKHEVVNAFFNNTECPSEVPGCDALRQMFNSEKTSMIQNKPGGCSTCQMNKLKAKYVRLINNLCKVQ